MNRQQATALVMYINRSIGIIPTTGLEWETIRGLLPIVEGVANGTVECTAASIKQPEPAAPTAASDPAAPKQD
jgi:hypothetical protein